MMKLDTKTDEEVVETIFGVSDKLKVMMPSIDRTKKNWVGFKSLKEFLSQANNEKYTPYMVFEMLKKEMEINKQ